MNKRYGNDEAAQARTRRELQANRYDPKTGTLVWTEGQVSAFEEIHAHLTEQVYNRKESGEGLKPGMIVDAEDTRAITSFIAWTAWTGVARRPGKTYSYTNNWPPEELVGNTLTGDAIMWSALSLVTLLGGSGLVLGFYGRHSRVVGWHESEERQIRFVPPASVALTSAQRVTAWYFLVVAALFLLQNLIGGATVHYMVETGGFFGIDLPKLLPYNLTPHLAPPDGDLLRGDGLSRGRDLPGPLDRRPRASRPGGTLGDLARGAGGGGLRQPRRGVPELPQPPAPRATLLPRGARVGISRSRPILDVFTDHWNDFMGGHRLPRA